MAPSRAVGSLQDLKRGLTNAKAAAPTRTIKPLARMMKGSGVWVYGREDTQIEVTSEWAVNPYSIQHGHVCWAEPGAPGKRKLGEIMAPITQAKPDIMALPDKGAPWTEQYGLDMKCVSGTDKGLETAFRSNAQGGIEAVLALIDAVDQQLDSGSDKIVPIVRLRSTSYQHPAYGKIYKPVFEIVGWTRIDEEPTGSTSTPPPAGGGGTGEPIRRRRVAA